MSAKSRSAGSVRRSRAVETADDLEGRERRQVGEGAGLARGPEEAGRLGEHQGIGGAFDGEAEAGERGRWGKAGAGGGGIGGGGGEEAGGRGAGAAAGGHVGVEDQAAARRGAGDGAAEGGGVFAADQGFAVRAVDREGAVEEAGGDAEGGGGEGDERDRAVGAEAALQELAEVAGDGRERGASGGSQRGHDRA